MHIIAFFLTILIGYLGAGVLGGYFGIPDGGSIAAIATMGSIILWSLKCKQRMD